MKQTYAMRQLTSSGRSKASFSKFLAEGKHWPEDYIKTAVNAIKASPLGQQSWYSDDYIKADVQTFASEFAPLSHKSSNLGFFMAIIRWFIEYSGTSKEKYQEFIERKLDKIIATLLKVRADKSYDAMAEQIKKMKFAEFEKLAEEVSKKTSADMAVKSDATFTVIPIYSYEELNRQYGGNKTGYKGESEWCHANGESTYDSWTKGGTQMFFVIEQDGWKNVKAPIEKPTTCYDAYGMSLIAILVDVKTNKLLNSTSRWNHVVLPKSGAADTMFETWDQLNKAVGMDVKSICRNECKGMVKKLQDEVENANRQVAEILSNVNTTDDITIPAKLKSLVTNVVIPENVTSIGSLAFSRCNNLTSMTIPDSVVRIGAWAFYSCTSLMNVTIPNGVTSIGSSTFRRCRSLTNVTIPDGVTSIGKWAFISCSGLMSVTIPDSVTSIGSDAFYMCTNLKKLIFKGKSIDEVKAMDNYPWGVEDESVFKCKDSLSENKQIKRKLKMKKDKKVDEASFKSFNDIDLSKIPGSVAEIFTTNFERFNSCKTYEDVVALCHQLLDDAKLDTEWTRKFFYNLEKIREHAPTPRAAYEQAMLFMNNARMRGMGLGMDRGGSRHRFYEGDELNESMDSTQKEEFKKKLRDGEVKFSYKKKDGSVRDARGTMKPELMDLPEKKSQPDVDSAEKNKVRKLPEDSVFYYDLDKKGFRSFKMANFVEYK